MNNTPPDPERMVQFTKAERAFNKMAAKMGTERYGMVALFVPYNEKGELDMQMAMTHSNLSPQTGMKVFHYLATAVDAQKRQEVRNNARDAYGAIH